MPLALIHILPLWKPARIHRVSNGARHPGDFKVDAVVEQEQQVPDLMKRRCLAVGVFPALSLQSREFGQLRPGVYDAPLLVLVVRVGGGNQKLNHVSAYVHGPQPRSKR